MELYSESDRSHFMRSVNKGTIPAAATSAYWDLFNGMTDQ
jgi:hypothetical protein